MCVFFRPRVCELSLHRAVCRQQPNWRRRQDLLLLHWGGQRVWPLHQSQSAQGSTSLQGNRTSYLNNWLIIYLPWLNSHWAYLTPPVRSVWCWRDEDSAATVDHLPQGPAGVWGQTQRSALQHPEWCFHHAAHKGRPQQHTLLWTLYLPVVSWGTIRDEVQSRTFIWCEIDILGV